MPISSRAELQSYLAADARAHGIDRVRPRHLLFNPTLRFQRLLRRLEYARSRHRRGPMRVWPLLLQLAFLRRSQVLGFDIPPNVFGPGLCIVHWGTIVVSGKAKVGANCRIHASTNIGEHLGAAPQLGDDCYVGPGAKLLGGIELGDGCVVGANAVVNRSFPPRSVIVGIPGRALSERPAE